MAPEDFWTTSGSSPCDNDVHIIDTAFVDDECIMISATTPQSLDKAIDSMLSVLTRVYHLLRLE
eukprot:2267175-Karenia_brevis.AAC.1